MVKKWSEMKLADEKARRRERKARELEQKLKQAQKDAQIKKIKLISVVLVIIAAIAGLIGLKILSVKKEKEIKIKNLKVINIEETVGTVEYCLSGENDFKPLSKIKLDFETSCKFKTRPDSKCKVLFANNISIKMFPDSLLEIIDIKPEENLNNCRILARLVQGECVVETRGDGRKLELTTPLVSVKAIEIGHCQYKVSILKLGKERLACARGAVNVETREPDPKNRQGRVIRPLKYTIISREKGISPPASFSALSEEW